MLRNQAVRIKAENVKGHLFAGSGKIVNRLQEHLVAILEGPNVVYGSLYRRGGQIGHGTEKGITAGAISQIVLNISFRQQLFCLFRITGSKSADQLERFLNICHLRFLLTVFVAAAKPFLK